MEYNKKDESVHDAKSRIESTAMSMISSCSMKSNSLLHSIWLDHGSLLRVSTAILNFRVTWRRTPKYYTKTPDPLDFLYEFLSKKNR